MRYRSVDTCRGDLDSSRRSSSSTRQSFRPHRSSREIAARLPEPLQAASRSLTEKLNTTAVQGLAARLADEMRGLLRDVGMDTFIADARSVHLGCPRARLAAVRHVDRDVARRAVSGLGARLSAVAARMPRARDAAGAASARPAKLPKAAKVRADGAGIASAEAAIARCVRAEDAVGRIAAPKMPSLEHRGADAAIARVGSRRDRSSLSRGARNRLFLGAQLWHSLALVVVTTQLDETIVNAVRSAVPSPTVAPRAALAPAPFEVPPLSAYGATFETQGAYPTTTPNGTVEWVVALRNTGSAGWYRGIEGAQAALTLPDGAGVAVQTTEYVAPGQVGWFIVHFRARAELGTYTVPLLPRIDGRGLLQDLGIFAVVTVAKNP